MPKSTCHTSPRSEAAGVLLLVKRMKRCRRQRRIIVIRQISGHGYTLNDGTSKLSALSFREVLECTENMCNGLRRE